MRRPLVVASLLVAALLTGCAAPGPAAEPGSQVLLARSRWMRSGGHYDYAEWAGTPFTFDTTVGVRMLTEDAAWAPVDDQVDLGLSFQVPLLGPDGYRSESPFRAVSWDLGFRYAFDDSESTDAAGTVLSDLDARTYDIAGGLLLSPLTRRAPIEPYVGAGIALLLTDVERQTLGVSASETDSALSAYVRTGARIDVGGGQHVGFDVRWLSGGDERIDGIGADAGSLSLSFLFGIHF